MNKKAVFLVGLSGVGKTTLARLILDFFRRKGLTPIFFDGNEMYDFQILKPENGHDIESRLHRAIHLTKIINWSISQNMIPVVAVIGQPKEARDYWRKHIDGYFEIYLKADLSVCVNRDDKNIYSSGRTDIIGRDIIFNEPNNSDLVLDTNNSTPVELLKYIVEFL